MYRLGIACAAIFVAVVSAGCWLQPGGDAGRTGFQAFESGLTPANVAQLDQVWSKSTAQFASSPVVWGGRVFVAAGGTMYAFDSATGAPLWQKQLGDATNPGSFGTPAVIGDKVVAAAFLGASGGSASFDPATGDFTTNLTFHSSFAGAPAVAPNVTAQIVVDFAPGNVFTGLAYGQAKRGFVDYNSGLQTAGPAVSPGGVAAVTIGHFLIGFPVGSCPTNPQLPPNFCAPSMNVDLGANAAAPVAIDANHFAVSLATGDTKVVNATSGAVEWTAPSGSTAAQPPALDGQGHFYVGTADGKLRQYPVAGCSSATCAATWTGNAGSAITTQPTVANGVLYAGTATKLFAFTPSTCASPCATPAMSATADFTSTSVIPVVNNGFVYAVASSGNVVAFKLFS